ncbi:MAG: cyclic lactone autoinducer peptide [Bacillota bacterium]|nr:cyclic lactone autoinducer peptide [Bacillota bacterium]
MKGKKIKILGILSAFVTLVALTISSTACYYWLYQPKAPKCLQK